MAAFDILNSCRFNSEDSARTTRTFSASDTTLWTLSFWVKRCAAFGTAQHIFSAGAAAADQTNILFDANDKLQYQQIVASSEVEDIVTDTVLRDPSTWYHIVVAYDSDNGTAADRLKIYINGVLQTTTGTDITSGRASDINAADSHAIGREEPDTNEYLNAYLADIVFVDGAQLAPTVFGQFAATGSWEAIDPAPTYGTNGFRLEFQTDTAFGDDTSGNVNDFTDSGLATNDQHTDTPSHNYAVINHIAGVSPNTVVSDGNRVIKGTSGGGAWGFQSATFYLESGKWYWEVDITAGIVALLRIGVAHQVAWDMTLALGVSEYSWGLENSSGTVLRTQNNGSPTTLTDTGTLQTGDYVMVAYDANTGKLWFGLNGSFLDSGDPAAGTGELFTIAFKPVSPAFGVNKTSESLLLRSDPADFEGAIPTGFNALSTANLALPIDTPSDYFDAVLYAGNGVAIGSGGKAITGLSFQPDLVWIKNRDTTDQHILTDAQRGVTKFIHTDSNIAEITDTEALSTFDSDGFTVGDNVQVNTNAENYVAYCWKEIAKAGFDIRLHTGTGVAHTVSHALGVIPDIFLSKPRTAVRSWSCLLMHVITPARDIELFPAFETIQIDNPNGHVTSPVAFDNTSPDASVFTVGTGVLDGNTQVVYLWANIEGFSKFDAYGGNASADGTFVWCGFRPKFVIIKRIDSSASWSMHDSARNVLNPVDLELLADDTTAETVEATQSIDFLGNGFKLRGNGTRTNASSAEYAFLAFAETPFALASTGPPPPLAGVVTMAMSVAGRGPANGAVIASMSVAGTATNSTIHANGAITLTMSVAAQAAPKAAVTLTMSVAATAVVTIVANGVLTATMTVAGTVIIPNTGRPIMAMSAAATAIRVSLIVGTSVAIPVVATSGIIINSPTMDVPNVVIPVLTIDGEVVNGLMLIGNLVLPIFTLDASMAGEGDIVIPVLQVTATMVAGRILTSATLPIPRIGVDGILAQDRVLFGSPQLVNVKTNGIIFSGTVISASLSIPNPQVDATITAGQVLDTPLSPLHSISGTRNTGAKFCS